MGHHSNDLSPLSLRCAHTKQDLLPHSRLVRKCLRRECLINYEQVAIRRAVFLRKGASSQESRAHRLEIAGKNDLKIGSWKLARILESFFFAPTHRTKPAGEGQWK